MQPHCTYLMGWICRADEQTCCNIVTKQQVRIMKLTAILLTVFFLQVKADGFGQGSVTYSGKDVPLEKVISVIKQQSGYSFFYTEDVWTDTKPVTVEVKNAPALKVLKEVLQNQPISFYIEEKVIILSKKKKQQNETSEQAVGNVPIDIRGKVVGENGSAIEGANVLVKGTNNGTTTNTAGEFVLKTVEENAIVVVSSVGYDKQELLIKGREFILVQLKINSGSLDEIQVIGYGKTTKRLNTGSVSSIKSSVIDKQPVSNPLLALQGRIPGIQVGVANGLPGASVDIRVRGGNNITGTNSPLYLIDGVPYQAQNLFGVDGGGLLGVNSGSPFNYLNPSDIESIDVLKDADATAIYGSRGANGVILITTKKGKAGRTKVDVNIQSGYGEVPNRMELLNTRQYLDMRYEAFKNNMAVPNQNVDYDLTLWDTTRFTDWQEVLIGGKAKYSDIKLSVSGGNSNTQFLIGSGYHKETTVFPGDFNNQKGSVQFSVNNTSTNQRFKIALSGFYVNDNNRVPTTDLAQAAVQMMPNAPDLYNPDGSLNWAPNSLGVSTWPGGNNPAASLETKFERKTDNLVSNSTVSFLLHRDLEVKATLGYSNTQSKGIFVAPLISSDPAIWATTPRHSIFSTSNIKSWIVEPQANYSRKISKGTLTILLGTTIQQSQNYEQSLRAIGFSNDQEMRNIVAAPTVVVFSSTNAIYKYNALFGRVNYNWGDKYLINITGRRDGSSRFGPANQFHNFMAVGAAWVFSKEKAVHDILPFLSFGKLRASYGTTGSDDIGDYTFMDTYSPISNIGVPYQGANGIVPSRIFTPDIQWQQTKKFESGVEIGLFNDRILFSGNYYLNRSSNQLLDFALPAITGFTAIKRNINAVVQNTGIELELSSTIISKKTLRLRSSINFSLNRNKLVSGGPGLSASLQRRIGHSMQTIFVYQFLYVDPVTGLYMVANSHGAPTLQPDPVLDAIKAIDLNQRFYGGFQNTINFKSLQLDFLFQFSKQPYVQLYLYNSIPGYVSNSSSFGGNQPVGVLNRWKQPGDAARYQRYSNDLKVLNTKANVDASDFLYGDGSYISLRNASLSWELPKNWQDKVHFSSKVFVQGQNLLVISKNKGMLNPEAPNPVVLPQLRVITAGVNITF